MSGLASPWRPFDVCLVYLGLQCFCVAGVGLRLRPPVVVPSFSISDPSTYLSLTQLFTYLRIIQSLTHYALLYICVLGVKQYILPTGRMYTAFLWYSSGIPLASLWCSLRDSRGTMRSAKGSDVRLASP